jgi:hypothetical protein
MARGTLDGDRPSTATAQLRQPPICGYDPLERRDKLGFFGLMVGGCGTAIARDEIYRCLDCCAPFHRHCLRTHCADTDCKDATISRLRRRLGKLVRIFNGAP